MAFIDIRQGRGRGTVKMPHRVGSAGDEALRRRASGRTFVSLHQLDALEEELSNSKHEIELTVDDERYRVMLTGAELSRLSNAVAPFVSVARRLE